MASFSTKQGPHLIDLIKGLESKDNLIICSFHITVKVYKGPLYYKSTGSNNVPFLVCTQVALFGIIEGSHKASYPPSFPSFSFAAPMLLIKL